MSTTTRHTWLDIDFKPAPPVSTLSRPTPKHAATTAPERMAAELAYLRNECHSIRHALDRSRARA